MAMITELENIATRSDSYKFCNRVFSSNKEIQSVELVNKNGRLVERISSSNTINLPSHKKEMFHMSLRLKESMNKEYDEDFGKVNYSCENRERVAIFSFGIGEDILIVTLPNKANSHSIAKKIIPILGREFANNA
jgi:hypothetical protein